MDVVLESERSLKLFDLSPVSPEFELLVSKSYSYLLNDVDFIKSETVTNNSLSVSVSYTHLA